MSVNILSVFLMSLSLLQVHQAAAAPLTVGDLSEQVQAADDRDDQDPITERKFNIRTSSAPLAEVIRMIASKGGLRAKVDSSVKGVASLNLKGATVQSALDRLADENSLEYDIDKGMLHITSILEQNQVRSAPSQGRVASGSDVERVLGSGNLAAPVSLRSIHVRYAAPSKMVTALLPLLDKSEMLIPDEETNVLLFRGSTETYEKLLEMLTLLDRMPQQILIEAQVVETSQSFLRALGINAGTNSQRGKGALFAGSLNPQAASANGQLKYSFQPLLGSGFSLDLQLSAAESEGQAKVISRPKVVTLNNKGATIHSGTTFYVKTVGNAVSTGGSTQIAGGLQALNSGLQLNVTPSIMGDQLVKLNVSINNSQPDESAAVDGVPGIVNNSANTSIIVGQKKTAVIAGLVKSSKGDSESGVPFLRSIPIIGNLFKSTSASNRQNEMVIFITPSIISPSDNVVDLDRSTASAVVTPEMADVPPTY